MTTLEKLQKTVEAAETFERLARIEQDFAQGFFGKNIPTFRQRCEKARDRKQRCALRLRQSARKLALKVAEELS